MRIFEIITETADTWETRFANHQRQRAKRRRLRAKLATATTTATSHQRQAADRRRADSDKLVTIRRQLAAPPSTT